MWFGVSKQYSDDRSTIGLLSFMLMINIIGVTTFTVSKARLNGGFPIH